MILVEETDSRFYITKSNIHQAGMGVFAAEDLKKDDYLEIIGVKVAKESIADKCTHYSNSYKFSSKPLNVENDYLIIPMGYAGIVNHAPTNEMQNAALDINTQLPKSNACSVVYRFIRDIKKDEEILGHYGKNWDDAFKWAEKNLKILDESKNDWETFLKLNLYNLEILRG